MENCLGSAVFCWNKKLARLELSYPGVPGYWLGKLKQVSIMHGKIASGQLFFAGIKKLVRLELSCPGNAAYSILKIDLLSQLLPDLGSD